jgi:hypothetical protein
VVSSVAAVNAMPARIVMRMAKKRKCSRRHSLLSRGGDAILLSARIGAMIPVTFPHRASTFMNIDVTLETEILLFKFKIAICKARYRTNVNQISCNLPFYYYNQIKNMFCFSLCCALIRHCLKDTGPAAWYRGGWLP